MHIRFRLRRPAVRALEALSSFLQRIFAVAERACSETLVHTMTIYTGSIVPCRSSGGDTEGGPRLSSVTCASFRWAMSIVGREPRVWWVRVTRVQYSSNWPVSSSLAGVRYSACAPVNGYIYALPCVPWSLPSLYLLRSSAAATCACASFRHPLSPHLAPSPCADDGFTT